MGFEDKTIIWIVILFIFTMLVLKLLQIYLNKKVVKEKFKLMKMNRDNLIRESAKEIEDFNEWNK